MTLAVSHVGVCVYSGLWKLASGSWDVWYWCLAVKKCISVNSCECLPAILNLPQVWLQFLVSEMMECYNTDDWKICLYWKSIECVDSKNWIPSYSISVFLHPACQCSNIKPHHQLCLYMCESESHSVVSDSLWPHGLYSPWDSPAQNTGVGSCSPLQGIFPTQE